MNRTLISIAIFLTAVAPALAWGAEGHKAIGDLARKLLTAKAREGVTAILGNDDLGAVASWADDVRSAGRGYGPLANDPEAAQINRDFPDNGQWHFVDLPLNAPRYPVSASAGDYIGTSPNDIVHAINRCIGVLDGTGPPATPQLTRSQALRFLIHFVGDIHQPLHVCSGYYRFAADGTAQLVVDPAAAKGLPSDKGGNDLHYGAGKYDNLHGLWDVDLVRDFESSGDPSVSTADKLLAIVRLSSWGPEAGDDHSWAAQWASDTLLSARTAYQGFTFGKAEFYPDDHALRQIAIEMDVDGYRRSNTNLAGVQMAKAGSRLAQLLNRIWK